MLSKRRSTLSLPLLAASLRIDQGDEGTKDEVTDPLLVAMLPPLCDLSLDASYLSRARSAAASSVVSIIRTNCLSNVDLAKGALEATILPALGACKDVAGLAGALRLMALVGGAAACRGGGSARSADVITGLLAELTVKGVGAGLDSSKFDKAAVRAVAGEGFGEMLGSEGGGAFWRQVRTCVQLPTPPLTLTS